MTRIRFRLSTLLLLTALIAAGLATRNRSSAWYLSKSIPAGFEGSFKLAAFEEQDLLVCLKTTIPERLVVRRLSTGEVLQDFGSDLSGAEFLQAGQDGKLYGFGPYRVNRINMKTGRFPRWSICIDCRSRCSCITEWARHHQTLKPCNLSCV